MSETQEPEVREVRVTLRSRLREKLPEILIEAVSVFLAVLIAFGVNAWHEHSQRADLAAQARTAILKELASNYSRLGGNLATLKTAMQQMRSRLESDAGDPLREKQGFPYNSFLASSAAWHSAQATGAVRDFNYAWMLEVAQVYEAQDLFVQVQRRLLEPVQIVLVPGMEKPDSAARKLFEDLQYKQVLVRMQIVATTGASLMQSYASVLDGERSSAQTGTAVAKGK